ncbi:MAG: DNA repair and recombination protein RadA [Candidatus Aenigmarchaeota archaeon]|nr:DNA repair and recombination protein RadA [Candidatus Aenigmarchaeota archaeon]
MVDKLKNLAGVGEKTAEKLREAGYEDLMAIAAASKGEICDAIEVGEGTAEKIIESARNGINMGFETAEAVYEKRKQIGKITTGSTALDDLLGGGFETGCITEAHGAFGSSKSQLAFQLAVNVQLPLDQGGLEGSAVFIDTENTFRPERVEQMAKAAGLDPEEALKNIFVARAYNSDHQILLVDKAKDIIKEKNVKVLIVDSLTSMFRTDYSGRGELAPRQQKLNRHLHELQKLSEVSNLAVYVTNQVMSNPAVMFGDPTTAIGGHILGHAATFRMYLRKSREQKRIVKLIDSPSLPDSEAIFKVTEDGIRD